MVRLSPEESATSFKEFTIKKGNDNNVWINIKDKNKVLKWKLLGIITPHKNIKLNLDLATTLLKKNNFYLIDTIEVTESLTVGDTVEINCAEYGFKKGKYYIYRLNDSILASKKKISNIKKIEILPINISVGCDVGAFVFRDSYKFNSKIKNNRFIIDPFIDIDFIDEDIVITNKDVLKIIEKDIQKYKDILKKIEKNNNKTYTKQILTKNNIKSMNDYNSRVEKINEYYNYYKKKNNIIVGGTNYYGDGRFDLCVSENKDILMQLGPSLGYFLDLCYQAGIENKIVMFKEFK